MLSLLSALHMCLSNFIAVAINSFLFSSRLSSSPLIHSKNGQKQRDPSLQPPAPWENPAAPRIEPGPHLLTASFWGQPATYLRKMPPERHSSSFSLLMGRSPRKATLYHALGTGGAQLSNSPLTLLAIQTPEGRRRSHSYPHIA